MRRRSLRLSGMWSDFSDWFWDPNFLPRTRRAAVADFFGAVRFALLGIYGRRGLTPIDSRLLPCYNGSRHPRHNESYWSFP